MLQAERRLLLRCLRSAACAVGATFLCAVCCGAYIAKEFLAPMWHVRVWRMEMQMEAPRDAQGAGHKAQGAGDALSLDANAQLGQLP